MPKKQVRKSITTYLDNKHPNPDFWNPYNLTGKDLNNDIWEGRKPHHVDPETGQKFYEVWFGSAVFSKDDILDYADVRFNHKVHLYIIGNRLSIIDIRYSGVIDSWGYCARDGEKQSIWPSEHELEDERIDKMLRLKNIDCPIWEPICRRAREIWMEEIAGRDRLRRYEPEGIDK